MRRKILALAALWPLLFNSVACADQAREETERIGRQIAEFQAEIKKLQEEEIEKTKTERDTAQPVDSPSPLATFELDSKDGRIREI